MRSGVSAAHDVSDTSCTTKTFAYNRIVLIVYFFVKCYCGLLAFSMKDIASFTFFTRFAREQKKEIPSFGIIRLARYVTVAKPGRFCTPWNDLQKVSEI